MTPFLVLTHILWIIRESEIAVSLKTYCLVKLAHYTGFFSGEPCKYTSFPTFVALKPTELEP